MYDLLDEPLPGEVMAGIARRMTMRRKEVNVSNVTFEVGCRNNWHIHHKACQILIAVGGRGYYQEWGKEPVELNPGDVVYVAPETKHWQGAAPDSDFAHIAIMNAVDGASNEWLEPVEAEYDALR